MGMEALVDEILQSAEKQADEILKNARKEARSIIRDAEAKISKLRKDWEEENDHILGDLRRKRKASAKLEASRILMNAKKELMDELFNSLLDRLEGLEKKEKEKLISKLADLVKKEIDVARVYCNKNEGRLISKYFKGASVRYFRCRGGFIAESKDSSVSVDMRYETLLDKVKKEITKEVGPMLFG